MVSRASSTTLHFFPQAVFFVSSRAQQTSLERRKHRKQETNKLRVNALCRHASRCAKNSMYERQPCVASRAFEDKCCSIHAAIERQQRRAIGIWTSYAKGLVAIILAVHSELDHVEHCMPLPGPALDQLKCKHTGTKRSSCHVHLHLTVSGELRKKRTWNCTNAKRWPRDRLPSREQINNRKLTKNHTQTAKHLFFVFIWQRSEHV